MALRRRRGGGAVRCQGSPIERSMKGMCEVCRWLRELPCSEFMQDATDVWQGV